MLAPNTDKIYVANTGSNSVSVMDGNNQNNIITNLTLPIDQSTTLTADPKTNTMYVSTSIRNQFFIINGSTDNIVPSSKFIQQNNVTIFKGGPTIIAINPNDGKIYAVNEYLNTVSVTYEKQFPDLIAIVNIGGSPSAIAVDTATNF